MNSKKIRKLIVLLLTAFIAFTGMIVSVDAAEPDPTLYESLGSDYIYVFDIESGQVLTEKNGEEKMYPASMTKMMTAIVAMEKLNDQDKKVEITNEMVRGLDELGASVAGFAEGDVVTVRDLFYGTALPSGADAANALAILSAGSIRNFVTMMNDKAKEIGMNDSHFANVTGLHDDDHYSTAHDMARLVEYCIKNETFTKVFSSRKYTSSPTQFYPDGILMQSTTWHSAETYGISLPDLIGSKTGFTWEAGHCLAWWADFNGMKLVGVNAHCDEDSLYGIGHLTDSSRLLERLHDYEKTTVVTQGDLLDRLVIHYSDHDETVDILSDETIIEDMRKGNEPVITSTLIDEVTAGLNDSEVSGIIRIEKDGRLMFEKAVRVTVPKEVKFFARLKMRWNSIFHKNG